MTASGRRCVSPVVINDTMSIDVCVEKIHYRLFFQAEDGIRDVAVTGVQTCALPIYRVARREPDSMSGEPTTLNSPMRGCWRVSTKPPSLTCGSEKMPSSDSLGAT